MKRRDFVGAGLGAIAATGTGGAAPLFASLELLTGAERQPPRQDVYQDGRGDSVTYFCHSDGACLSIWPQAGRGVEE